LTPSSRNSHFAEPALHPKWKEVSLPAPLAGWNRLPLAQEWLDKHGVEPVKRRFEAFLQENQPR